MSRLRVLVSAYACEPDKGSEPGTGWHWVAQISRSCDTWVLTDEEHREGIERATAAGRLTHVRWTFVKLPRWLTLLLPRRMGRNVQYYIWQLMAFARGRALQREVGFDLVHHVTWVRHWTPSFLAFLSVPLVFGPVGSGERPPPSMSKDVSILGRLDELARRLSIFLGERDPFLRAALKRSRIAIAATRDTAERLHRLGARQVEVLHPPVGISREHFASLPASHPGGPPFRFISVGRILHWKGFHIGLRAFAAFHHQHPSARYWIVGTGPELRRLRGLAEKLGIASAVHFPGHLERDDYFALLSSCTAFLYPSYHDPGAWVVVEAMACAKPVICLETGGPGHLVPPDAGILLPNAAPEELVRLVAQGMRSLVEDPDRLRRMSDSARRHVAENFLWEHKAGYVSSLYARALVDSSAVHVRHTEKGAGLTRLR